RAELGPWETLQAQRGVLPWAQTAHRRWREVRRHQQTTGRENHPHVLPFLQYGPDPQRGDFAQASRHRSTNATPFDLIAQLLDTHCQGAPLVVELDHISPQPLQPHGAFAVARLLLLPQTPRDEPGSLSRGTGF